MWPKTQIQASFLYLKVFLCQFQYLKWLPHRSTLVSVTVRGCLAGCSAPLVVVIRTSLEVSLSPRGDVVKRLRLLLILYKVSFENLFSWTRFSQELLVWIEKIHLMQIHLMLRWTIKMCSDTVKRSSEHDRCGWVNNSKVRRWVPALNTQCPEN